MSADQQLGVRVLKVLDAAWMVAVLRGLQAGVSRPAELEERLGTACHSMVMRRLGHLLDSGLVTHEYLPGLPPQAHRAGIQPEAHYSLTDAGQGLLEVIEEAVRWERTWLTRDERHDPDGTLAIKFTADLHVRKITLLLADGPLCGSDLEARKPDLVRSALRKRLQKMILAGLLKQSRLGRARVYELTDGARHLALVAVLAGRWEWQWWRPEAAAPVRDLNELLHLLAPAAQVPEPIAGICQLHFDVNGADDPDVYLAARAGHLVLAEVPTHSPEAVGHARPEAWCDALLSRHGSITVSGNEVLLVAVMEALSTALLQ